MTQARAIEPRARERQHVVGEVEAKPALDLAAEEFEHAPSAGAEIEQRAERPVGECRADRCLDLLVCDVKLADAVPLGSVAAEIDLRRRGPRRAHRREAFAVARNRRIRGVEPRDQFPRERRVAAALGKPEESP